MLLGDVNAGRTVRSALVGALLVPVVLIVASTLAEVLAWLGVPAVQGPFTLDRSLLMIAIPATILGAAAEEVYFRGVLVLWLGEALRLSSYSVVIPSTLLFTLGHAPTAGTFGSALSLGLLCGYLTARERNIVNATVLHCAVNLTVLGMASLS